MSDENQGGAPKKKLSTQEILAAARAEAGKSAPAAEPAAATPASETAGEAPPAKKAPAATAGATDKPKSTSDILARARAEAARKAGAAASATAEEAPPAGEKPVAPKPPAAGGKPKSTADILAAARATAGAKAAPSAPAAPSEAKAKPAPKEKPAKAPAAAADEGSKLSVQEMLAAVRPGAAGTSATTPEKPVKPAGPPPMPAKPAPTVKKAAVEAPRRNFLVVLLLTPFALAWFVMGGAATVWALAMARFMLPNVLAEPPSKFKIGPPTDFDLGTVATKLVAQYGIWVVHTDQYQGKNLIYALVSVCTHLGCTPSWLEGEQKFKCPCHGSGFYITGINFEGPAPRPLERAAIRLAPDGMLEVDKSVKFQEEMGQWNDPTSYYEVVA
ncbi:MAG: ubiquinol-cytochrome c reductase iron-sulfur subunit [Planctomycetaceae bacterium]